MIGSISKLLSNRASLLVLSVVLLLSFGVLFYADRQVTENLTRLNALTVNAGRILTADLQSTTAVRLAASLRSDLYIADYQGFQDTKYALLEEIAGFEKSPTVQQFLSKTEDVQGDIENAEAEAIALIDQQEWDDALVLVTEPAFTRLKDIYRANLSSALGEMIVDSENQAQRAATLYTASQFGAMGMFLVLAAIGVFYSRRMQQSLARQSELAGGLRDANEKLEERILARTAELNESRSVLKSILDNMPAAVFLKDNEGRFRLINRRYEEIYGVRFDDVVGKELHDIYPKEQADKFLAYDRRVLEAGTLLETQHDVTVDGESMTLAEIMFPFRGEDGTLSGFGGIEIDVTERVKSEETARRLREAIEGFSDGIILFDKDERVVFTNDIYHELYPTSPPKEEIVGWSQEQLLRRIVDAGLITAPGAKDDPEAWIASRLEARRKDRFLSFESVQESGRAFLIRQRPTSDGGLIVAHTDITDRKNAEQAIEAQRAQLDSILRNLQQAVVLVDKDRKIAAWNDQFPEALGIDEEILKPGLPVYDIGLMLANRGVFGDGDPEALAQENVDRLWAEVLHADLSFDGVRSFDARSSVMPDGGLLITYSDITERKQAEQAIEAQRARLDDILNNLQQAVVVFDKDQRLVACNAKYPDTLGIDKSILKPGLPIFEIAHTLAKRGDYGGGDPEELARSRVNTLWVGHTRGDISFGDERSFDADSSLMPDGGLLITYTDITERKRIEEALKTNEQQLRHILENSPIAIAISVDDQSEDDGIIEFANGRFVDMLGFDAKDIGHVRTREFFAEREGRDEHERQLDQGHTLMNMENRIKRQDGTDLWALMSISPLQFNGRQSALIWLYDITERKRSEKELAEKEAQLRAALTNMSDGIYAVDSDLRFVLYNERAMDMSGLPLEEVGIGTPVEKVIRMLAKRGGYGPGDVEAHVQKRLAMLSDGQHHELEFTTRSNDRVVNLRKSPLANGGAVVLLADVTERKKQEERFRSLLESAPDATVIVNEDGEIVQTNLQTEKLFGYSTEELLGQKVEILVPERFREQHPTHREGFFKKAGVRPMGAGLELFGRAKDGTEFPIELSLSPIETDEGLLVSGAIRDITERKKAEVELRLAKEQAESALAELKRTQVQLVTNEKMASLGQLTAGIAHEIKNPLNFVNNFSETSVELLIELAEALGPVQDKFDEDTRDDVEDIVETLKGDLQKINHHGKRADHIVKSMLLHARGDAGERVPTSVNELVDEAFNLAYHGERARDKSSNVTMEQNLDEAAGEAEILPQDITRVLVNLFGNASYAVKQRSKQAGNGAYEPTVTVWTKDKGAKVEIRVRDNGTGMPKEVREKLFEPFFTTKPTGEGTGPGLSMSFDIIAQQHDGHIAVDSEPGAFTEFVISLPRHPKKQARRAEKEQTA